MKTIELTITKEDFNKRPRYMDNQNCPLAKCVKRTLGISRVCVGLESIDTFPTKGYSKLIEIGKIDPYFDVSHFMSIRDGITSQFKTTLTITNPEYEKTIDSTTVLAL